MGKKGGGGGGMPGDLMGMLQQAQQQAEKMKQRMDDQLKEMTVEGSTGGGVVKIEITGTQLSLILDGVDLSSVRQRLRYRLPGERATTSPVARSAQLSKNCQSG